MSADVTIVATDPDPAALEHARAKPGTARVAWQTADPHALPFKDATFGVIACLFAASWFKDRRQAFREVHRVMKPGGRFLLAVPAHVRHNPVADCVDQALAALFPSHPPRFISRVLHGYADNEAIDDDLTAAGFTDATYTVVEAPFAAERARDVAVGHCQGLPVRREIAAMGDADAAVEAVTAAVRRQFGTGPVSATMRAQMVVASG
jgi:SAM-dependent methyltransferase